MSNQKYIRITSSDKIDTSVNNGNFSVALKDRITTQGVRAILVKELWIPNTFYNIRSSSGFINNLFKMRETGQADISPTIQEGQYNIVTFMNALQTSINALLVSGTVAITLDTLTNKIVFTFTGTTADFIYDYEDGNLMASTVGITETIAGPSAVITAQSLPDLSGISAVFVHSPDLSLNETIDGDFGLIDSLESISFNNVPFGSMGYKQTNYDSVSSVIYPSVKNLSTIRITLRDQYGNILDPGTSDIIIVLKIIY